MPIKYSAPSCTDHLARYPLAFLPTPLHPIPRANAAIGGNGPKVELWIKRDDQTGLAGGGNKTRKLEFLIADALAQGADTVLTVGAVQSNHCRQTAAAAARAGLACHLVLSGAPPAQAKGNPRAPLELTGNLLLDRLLGAKTHWTTPENRFARLAELADELRAAGHRAYPIPYGGSDAIGASGYALALEELRAQCSETGFEPDLIVIPSSSGGTQAGLVAGRWALGWDVPILGISVDPPEDELRGSMAELATKTAAHLGRPRTFSPDEILVCADYLGGGYGVVGELERNAITLLARAEGILIDPVYTGRAFGGLVDLLRRGIDRYAAPRGPSLNILFWHTGGAPALFAYASELTS